MTTDTYFKIRSKQSKLYCKGTRYARHSNTGYYWSEKGKIWPTIGDLRRYLKSMVNAGGIPNDWEVVELKITIESVKSPFDWVDPRLLIDILKKTY